MPTHRFSKLFPAIFLTLDLLSLNIGYYVANYFTFSHFPAPDAFYLHLQVAINAVWVLTFFSTHLYRGSRESGLVDNINRVLTAIFVNLSIVFALWFFLRTPEYSREHLFYIYLIFSVAIISWRIVWHYAIRAYRAKGYNYRNVVIVGKSSVSEKVVDYFKSNPAFGYRFLGYFDDQPAEHDLMGRIRELKDKLLNTKVDFIYVDLQKLKENQLKQIIDFADNHLIKVKIISQLSEFSQRQLSIQNYGAIQVVNISSIPLDNKINQIVKRIFDIVFSLCVIIFVLSWLMPLVGIIISLESPGPVFFKQARHGLNNKKFVIYKFRTMVVHKDEEVKQATRSDNRVTRFGAFLRKSSIDELPQFINVLKGDMSVVGPRPHACKHNEEFSKQIDRFVQRHAVKPGITGLAQANGFRGETSTYKAISGRVRLDRFYVKNWSIYMDIKIIFQTIYSIIRGSENAY